uniref:GAG-pre-integrase domain-containing protein n=1 Tax=Lactuca sativa TaxID=4236 RepID=A0A9R1UX01_LACSA|nr:hypothetical protein LSAT_V11C700376940 [Lactuca sativa]
MSLMTRLYIGITLITLIVPDDPLQTGQCIFKVKEHIWYLDNDYSRHMIGYKSWLDDFIKKDGMSVIYNVSYMKGLQHNLVSISQLCDAGYEVYHYSYENQQNDIYVLDMFSTDKSLRRCFFSRAQSHLNWLCHKRLSHLNFKNILRIVENQLVRGIPKLQFVKDKNFSAVRTPQQMVLQKEEIELSLKLEELWLLKLVFHCYFGLKQSIQCVIPKTDDVDSILPNVDQLISSQPIPEDQLVLYEETESSIQESSA